MMWSDTSHSRSRECTVNSTPPSPAKSFMKKPPHQPYSFHILHKVPLGDSPYVRAKHVQIVDKDPDKAIAYFWAAINEGDRVGSALKDMAILMKQQNRSEEAIEAIKSFRSRCSDQAQEALDNILLDLYKKCGRSDEQIDLLMHKLHLIQQGLMFNGKRTKTARSQGKKFQVSVEKEATRLLGNLGWVFMQQLNYTAAEAVYRKALSIEPDINRMCNLGVCLMKQGRLEEAKTMLQKVLPTVSSSKSTTDSHARSFQQAQELLLELERSISLKKGSSIAVPVNKESPTLSQAWIEGASNQIKGQFQWAGGHFHTSDILLETKNFVPCVVEDNRVSKNCLQAALATTLDRLGPLKNAFVEDEEAYMSLQSDLTTRVSDEAIDRVRDTIYHRVDSNDEQDFEEQGLDFTCVSQVVESVIPDTRYDIETLKSIPDDSSDSRLCEMEFNIKCQRRLQVFSDMTLPTTQQV